MIAIVSAKDQSVVRWKWDHGSDSQWHWSTSLRNEHVSCNHKKLAHSSASENGKIAAND
jgi:hypothetical protein